MLPSREWYDWLPVHHLTTQDVFSRIAAAGQEPYWVYGEGMTRMSCIMASRRDLVTAVRLRPDLLETIHRLEQDIGHVMMMPQGGHAIGLKQIVADAASDT